MPPSVPARMRHIYVTGVLGVYELPTLGKCEKLITQMTQLLRSDECTNDPVLYGKVEQDRDLCLDRWARLSFEFHERTAMKTSR